MSDQNISMGDLGSCNGIADMKPVRASSLISVVQVRVVGSLHNEHVITVRLVISMFSERSLCLSFPTLLKE